MSAGPCLPATAFAFAATFPCTGLKEVLWEGFESLWAREYPIYYVLYKKYGLIDFSPTINGRLYYITSLRKKTYGITVPLGVCNNRHRILGYLV